MVSLSGNGLRSSVSHYTFYTHAERDPDMFEMRVTLGYWVSPVVAVKHSVSNELSS